MNFKKIFAVVLIISMLATVCMLSSCSNETTKQIIKTEIVNGELWITYSDAPDTPVNAGRVEPSYEGTEGLSFHLLPDGTYGVTGGTADQLDKIVIPSTYNDKAVTKILDEAFIKFINLKQVIIPDTVTSIGSRSFSMCTQLESVVVPASVVYIGEGAFSTCSSLKAVTLSNSIQSVGSFAFANTLMLKEIVIPASVAAMGRDVFLNNTETVIKCEAAQKPEKWDSLWSGGPTVIVWGYNS